METKQGKSKISVNKKSICVPIYVIRSGKHGLTICCADSRFRFKVGTTPEQLQKLRKILEILYIELVEGQQA